MVTFFFKFWHQLRLFGIVSANTWKCIHFNMRNTWSTLIMVSLLLTFLYFSTATKKWVSKSSLVFFFFLSNYEILWNTHKKKKRTYFIRLCWIKEVWDSIRNLGIPLSSFKDDFTASAQSLLCVHPQSLLNLLPF